jgi:ABC-type transport system involved in Fe-S cluster assembly fused permease/ATPase subunit
MLIELGLGSYILATKFGPKFSAIILATFIIYIFYTISVTQWKINIRQKVVDVDGKRNSYFIDSILNHEVVKLFNRGPEEMRRYDSFLADAERLYISTTYAVAVLNLGQAAIFGSGLVMILLLSAANVRAGIMTVGELVAINAMMMQLSMPFNWMGMTYQEIREALVDMGYIKTIMTDGHQMTASSDPAEARDLDVIAPRQGPSQIDFQNVYFRYNSTSANGVKEQLLANLSFTVEPGQNVAIVGPSGSGKSTVLKLMTRLLESKDGKILIDGVDTKTVSLTSLRNRIAVIPQGKRL